MRRAVEREPYAPAGYSVEHRRRKGNPASTALQMTSAMHVAITLLQITSGRTPSYVVLLDQSAARVRR
jgi:hypothetical protein